MTRKAIGRTPKRWRWANNKKTHRELWHGAELLASVEEEGGDGPRWTWRVVGSERRGMSEDRWRCEVEALAVQRSTR